MKAISAKSAAKMAHDARSRRVRLTAENIENDKYSEEVRKLLSNFFLAVDGATLGGSTEVVFFPLAPRSDAFEEFHRAIKNLGYITKWTEGDELIVSWK